MEWRRALPKGVAGGLVLHRFVPAISVLALVAAACGRTPQQASTPEARPASQAASVARGASAVGPAYVADYSDFFCHRKGPPPAVAEPFDPEAFAREHQAREQAAEARAIAATAGRVRREGLVLTVGKTRFETKPFEQHEAQGVDYTYLGRMPGAPFDVVRGLHYEWTTWNVVGDDGRIVELSGPPAPSPDGRAFVSAGNDDAGVEFDGLQIAQQRNGVFEIVEVEAPMACDPRWTGPDELSVKIVPGATTEQYVSASEGSLDPSAWKTVRVVRDGAGWKIIPPAA